MRYTSNVMFLLLFGCVSDLEIIYLENENNYQFSSTIIAESTPIVPETDEVLRWSNLDRSLLGVGIDPTTDIEKLSILHFPRLSEEEILTGINNESLKQADLSEYAEYFPVAGETEINLSEFSFQGTHLDPSEHLEDETGRFLVNAISDIGDTQMLCFFYTDPGSELDTGIELHTESAILDYEIDIASSKFSESNIANRYVVDWQGLTTSGTGKDLQAGQIDTMMLASFEEEIEVIEDNFLQLPSMAIDTYEADVLGKTAVDLTELGFAGFGEKKWLFVLRCRMCINPAPLFVGVIAEK
jgi:hypothetical protein